MRRIACELVELRVLLFNIHRDPKKSPPLSAEQIAPDLFNIVDRKQVVQQQIDAFAESVLDGFSFNG